MEAAFTSNQQGGGGAQETGSRLSRFTTRPAGQVRRLSKVHGSIRVGVGCVQNLTGRVGAGQGGFKSHGSGRVGSSRFGPGHRDPREETRPVKTTEVVSA